VKSWAPVTRSRTTISPAELNLIKQLAVNAVARFDPPTAVGFHGPPASAGNHGELEMDCGAVAHGQLDLRLEPAE